MIKLKMLFPTACALAVVAMPLAAVRADAVYNGISLISGEQSSVQSFNLSGPGSLTMTLSSIPWLDTVSNLSGFLSDSTGQIGTTITGTGTESFDLAAGGTYYAHWFGDAQGVYNLGVIGMKIDFQPSGVAPVPLSKSLVFMLSGLGLLFGWQSRRPAAPVAPSQLAAC